MRRVEIEIGKWELRVARRSVPERWRLRIRTEFTDKWKTSPTNLFTWKFYILTRSERYATLLWSAFHFCPDKKGFRNKLSRAVFSLSALSNIFLIWRRCSCSARPLLRPPRKLICFCFFSELKMWPSPSGDYAELKTWTLVQSVWPLMRLGEAQNLHSDWKQQIQCKWKIIQTKCSGREHAHCYNVKLFKECS